MKANKKMAWVFTAVFLIAAGLAEAGNDALAQAQTVTAGERVANYLQSLMVTVCGILEAKKPGDLVNAPEVFRVAVIYNPEEKMIDISVVGNQADPVVARQKLELAQKMVMSFNKKIQKNFGVTLNENDINMDYLDAKTSRIILKFRDGKFQAPATPVPEKPAEPSVNFSP